MQAFSCFGDKILLPTKNTNATYFQFFLKYAQVIILKYRTGNYFDNRPCGDKDPKRDLNVQNEMSKKLNNGS